MRPVAQIAQSVEQGIENPRVGGSIPSLGTTFSFQVVPSTPENTQKARLVRAFCFLRFASRFGLEPRSQQGRDTPHCQHQAERLSSAPHLAPIHDR